MKYLQRTFVGCILALTASVANAETISMTYICERGVEVPVIYVNPSHGDDPALAILMAEGQLVRLKQEVSASGARYGWPADGSSYEWWEHQGTAMLNWIDGETDESSPIYRACTPQE
ncbi:MliC family protein [Pontibaca salina]|uniref:MliC family protein n=1 Tax=Pontibaca salina TaxID=2795731 RepID=A0A934HNT8_9RHOB|nr:MliC family protein [Pontibaca salina]MBI6628997.1 MliC family protein [Pontibaca salina]